MIKPGSTITLRPYMTFKDDPEKDKEFLEVERDGCRTVYFQVLDKNRDPATKKSTTGFCNIRIITQSPLRAWDRVQVKEIKGVKLSRGKPLLIISIIETGEKYVRPKVITGFEEGEENDF